MLNIILHEYKKKIDTRKKNNIIQKFICTDYEHVRLFSRSNKIIQRNALADEGKAFDVMGRVKIGATY